MLSLAETFSISLQSRLTATLASLLLSNQRSIGNSFLAPDVFTLVVHRVSLSLTRSTGYLPVSIPSCCVEPPVLPLPPLVRGVVRALSMQPPPPLPSVPRAGLVCCVLVAYVDCNPSFVLRQHPPKDPTSFDHRHSNNETIMAITTFPPSPPAHAIPSAAEMP